MLGATACRPGTAGAECHRGRPRGVWLRCRRGTGLGLGFGLGCGLRSWRLAAVLSFGWVAGAGLVGAWALAAAGFLALGAGLWARLGGFPRGLGAGVLDENLMVVVDEVVVLVEVVELEAEERAVGDGGGPWASGAGVGCWVLQVARTRVVIGHGVKIANAMGRACAASTCRCITGSARTQRYEIDNQK